MNKLSLPKIRLEAKPAGLSFRVPASALAKWDRTIKAAAKQSAAEVAIDIMGEVGDSGWGMDCMTAAMVKAQLGAAGKSPVFVTLNSPGGDAFEGIAIYNLLRDHPASVTVNVIGLAASAASIVAMAGDKIIMGDAAMLMIHSAWGLVIGNRNDMRDFAGMLDKIDTSVAALYAQRSGMSVADVLAMMETETWMTGPEAVENGFADSCVPPADKKKMHAARSISLAQKRMPVLLAASGDKARPAVRLSLSLPGAAGNLPKETTMKTVAEQISSFEQKRAASAERMGAIMGKAADEGRTLDETETQEYDGLVAEVKAVDDHLVRLKAHEVAMVARAAPITAAVGADPAAASAVRANSGIVSVAPNVEKGIPFTRYVKALAMAKGNLTGALAIAQNNQKWMDETPQVAKVLMAAVAGGDTTTSGWASELVYLQNLASEFIGVLRPKTILGRIPNLTMVPFNVRIAGADQGTSAYWVGQGKAIPVSKMHTTQTTLGIAKAAGLVVMTQELIRSSAPSAELMVRNDLVAQIAQFLDQQFIAPDYAAVANVSPASVTNGVTPTAATGTTSAYLRADVQTLFGTWITNNLDPSGGVWVMTSQTALAISLMLNALGQPVFPTITMNGGTFFGLPVITSQSAMQVGSPVAGEGNLIVLINAPEILLADDGQVTIDASAEASLEMLDNPTNNAAAGTPTTMVSMFQTDSVALRAIRFVNWAKRRAIAVSYIKDAMYTS